MRLFNQENRPSLPILLRAVIGTCAIAGACTVAAVMLSHHGWIFGPLYGGSVWGWYFLEVRIRKLRTFGSIS
jgi:hypothetical protein